MARTRGYSGDMCFRLVFKYVNGFGHSMKEDTYIYFLEIRPHRLLKTEAIEEGN